MFPFTRPTKKRRTPSPRNLEIYDEIMLNGKTQEAMAAKHGVSQARISQIMESVEGWRAQAAAVERGELPPEEKQRNEQWLSRQRNHELYRRNIRSFDESSQPLTTTKTIEVLEEEEPENQNDPTPSRRLTAAGSDSGGESIPAVVDRRLRTVRVETTVREQRANASYLRSAFAANKELARQAELKPLPEPKPAENFQQEHDAVNDWLWRQRRKAEEAGKVPASAHPGCFVNNWLAVLLGDNPGLFSPGFTPPGPAVKEIVRRFVLTRVPVHGQQPGGEDLVEDVFGEPIGTNHPAYPGMEYPFPVVHEQEEGGGQTSEVGDQGTEVADISCLSPAAESYATADGEITYGENERIFSAPLSSAERPLETTAGGWDQRRAPPRSGGRLAPAHHSSDLAAEPPAVVNRRLGAPQKRPGFSIAAMEAEILQERLKAHLKNMVFKRT